MDFDSVTVSPYMGRDSIEPFLRYDDKYTILLGLTSNTGANDFQISDKSELDLFKLVLKNLKTGLIQKNLMYVIVAKNQLI